MTAVDTTIVVLALPEIQRGLHVALSAVIWVIISFLLVITLLATQVGRLGDMFGRVRMYEMGFVVFVLGSLACGLAWNEASIIAFRVVQGIGGAFIMANSGAVIADLYPRELRGRAYGFTSVGWTMGAVIGIVLGGLIVTYVSWRWIFLINVPVGVAALAVAVRVLHDRAERTRRRLDLPGMITLGLGLFGVLWAMTRLATTSFDAAVAGYLIAGLALIGVFVLIERHQARAHAAAIHLPDTDYDGVPAGLDVPGPGQLRRSLPPDHVPAGPAGLVPHPRLAAARPGLRARSGSRAVCRTARRPALAGAARHRGARHPGRRAGHLRPAQQRDRPVGGRVASIINGIGAGFFFPANSSAVMKAAPPEAYGIASGMLRTFANIGMVFSFAVAILIASRSISRGLAFAIFVGSTSLHGALADAFTSGLHAAFYASMGLMALAAAPSRAAGLLLPGGRVANHAYGATLFPAEFAARYRERGYWADQPLFEGFTGALARYADRIAVADGEGPVTYRELSERSARLARVLLDLGFGPLDRIIVQLPNTAVFAYLYFALQRIGAAPGAGAAGAPQAGDHPVRRDLRARGRWPCPRPPAASTSPRWRPR